MPEVTENQDTAKLNQMVLDIVEEEVMNLHIREDGTYTSSDEDFDVTDYVKKFCMLENGISNLALLIHGKIKIQANLDLLSASVNNNKSFDENGKIPEHLEECPYCHKEVEKLLSNGYCSNTCATRARIENAQKKVSAAGERTLEIINTVREKLQLLDLALNLLTLLPELIKNRAKLPPEFREYVTLRIDCLFLQLKKYVNELMIKKNDLLIELMKKIKFGDLDDTLASIIAPINEVIQVVQQVQVAMNVAITAVIKLLDNPLYGIPPMSYGWFLTAKSFQYPETAGRFLIEVKPKINLAMGPLSNRLNNIDTARIEEIIRNALPPIQGFEYFLEPTAFKIRYAFSSDNTPKVKKMLQILESLVVLSADTFPRYKRLSLINPWFVLAILTGWSVQSRTVFGDFIFHAMI